MPNCVHSFVRASSASAVELLTDLRVRKKDLVADEATLYYNGNWQVLAESDANGTTQRWFVYGNYIDEALMVVSVGVMYDESADNNRGTAVYCGRRLP